MERFRHLWGQRDDQHTWEQMWSDRMFKCGICVVVFISVLLLIILLFLSGFPPGSVQGRRKREMLPVHHDYSSDTGKNHYELNLFKKYADYTAKKLAPNKECYICAYHPSLPRIRILYCQSQ